MLSIKRRPAGLAASFVIDQERAVGKTTGDLGVFKGLQRAANQWVLKNKQLVLTPVDGQPGRLTMQIVRDGIILARQLGNTLAQQEPLNLADLATYAGEYAITLASLAGVTVDNDPSCRSTDYRGDLKACANVTDPPPSSLLGGGADPGGGEGEGEGIPLVDTGTPKVSQAGFPWWIVLLGGGAAATYAMVKRRKKPAAVAPSVMMGLRRRRRRA